MATWAYAGEPSCRFILANPATSSNSLLRIANCKILPDFASARALTVHSGWMANSRGGLFVRLDGNSVLVSKGRGLGLRDAHPITGAWVGVTRAVSLASHLMLLVEGWVVMPRSGAGSAIQKRRDSRFSPGIMAGASIAKEF